MQNYFVQRREIILKKLAEDLFQQIVPINEGYDYLFTDEVYVPIYETTLVVTKRTIMPISLVEEKILQLIDVGILQIDELTKILGVNRRLLEVTLADLYSKDLIAVSSDSCRMLTPGKEALNKLNRTEKKQDRLKNVYLDGVLGNIIDATDYQLLNEVRNHDGKLKPQIPIGNVTYYIEKFEEVSQIFVQENKMFFMEGVQPIQEELLKIDEVENTYVKFIKLPIHVYVSSNGVDIDIVAVRYRMKELLETYKDYIIEQLNNKKVLKGHFRPKTISERGYVGELFREKEGLVAELKKIHFNKNKKDIDYSIIEKNVLCNRKLLDGEYREILRYLAKMNEHITLHVDNLDDWAYDLYFTGALQDCLGKGKLSICFRQSRNEKKSIEQIERSFSNIEQYEKRESECYICWEIGEYLLYGVPALRNVIDENTKYLKTSFYLKKNGN